MKALFATIALCVFLSSVGASHSMAEVAVPAEEPTMLRAAIFVQNRAGKDTQDKIDLLGDLISARLTEKGISIIDSKDVVGKISSDGKKSGVAAVEDAVSGASALRLSQMIGADYIVLASISSFGEDSVSLKGQGTNHGISADVKTSTLRITLKILEGNQGGSVSGDTIAVSERSKTSARASVDSTEILNRLVDAGAQKIADSVGAKVERIRNVKIKSVPVVEFSVTSNVPGATVELDGVAIGSVPGRFAVAPGLHAIRVTKEWCITWEKTANIFPNQVLNVTLELSDAGIARYKSMEEFKVDLEKAKNEIAIRKDQSDADISIRKDETAADIAIRKDQSAADIAVRKDKTTSDIAVAKEQSEADAFAKKKLSEGMKKNLEESYDRVEIKKDIQGHQDSAVNAPDTITDRVKSGIRNLLNQ